MGRGKTAAFDKEAQTYFRGRLPYTIRITRVYHLPEESEALDDGVQKFDFRGYFKYAAQGREVRRVWKFSAHAILAEDLTLAGEDKFIIRKIDRRNPALNSLRVLISDLLYQRRMEIREHLMSKMSAPEESLEILDAPEVPEEVLP